MNEQNTNKDQYKPLEMEVIAFDSEDVITTSNELIPVNPWDEGE